MNTPEQPQQPHNHPRHDDEIDLRDLVQTLWQQRLVVILCTLAGAVLGITSSLLSTQYVSEGVFETPNVSVTDYQRYSSALTSRSQFRQFLEAADIDDEEVAALLQSLGENPGRLADTFSPVRAEEEENGRLVGIHIRFAHDSPTHGKAVEALAEYARHTLLHMDLTDTTRNRCHSFSRREQEISNALIDTRFNIRQAERRAETLNTLSARRTNGDTTLDLRPIVTLDNGDERFLPPGTQLTATEIRISDMQLRKDVHARDRIAYALQRDFYCKAREALRQVTPSPELLHTFETLQTAAFEGHDKATDIVEMTWNEITLQRQSWENTYLDRMSFLAPPEGSETKQRSPTLSLGLALGLLLGGMIGVMAGLIRSWWRNNPSQQ